MGYPKRSKNYENTLDSCERFSSFINRKRIKLNDREFLSYKKFIREKKNIQNSENIVEILLGYIATEIKPKTLIICDHITSKCVRHKAKKYLNHNCSFHSCFDVVSDHELKIYLNHYHRVNWDRVIVIGKCEYAPIAKDFVSVTTSSRC